MKKLIVDVEYVRWLKAQLKVINDLDLSEITFREDGKEIAIADQVRDDWKFTGLNNADFVATGVYKLQQWDE